MDALKLLPLLLVPLLVFFGYSAFNGAEKRGFGCDSPLLLVHYHKTGHDASRVIASALSSSLSITFDDVMSRPDAPATTCHNLVGGAAWQSCYGVQASPDLLCRPFPLQLRVVHFERQPTETVISAYLYHSQEPPPEPWVHSRHPCAVRTRPTQALRRFADAAGVPSGQLEAVTALCHQLQPPNASFHQALRSLPASAGVRLVATWMISSQGDLLRMAANSRSLANVASRRAGEHVSHYAIDLGELSQSAPRVLSGLATWLHNSSIGMGTALRGEERTKRLADDLTSRFVSAQTSAARKSERRHVTHELASQKERARLSEALATDPTLSPVLRRVESILRRTNRGAM